jgi:hypothetical protein
VSVREWDEIFSSVADTEGIAIAYKRIIVLVNYHLKMWHNSNIWERQYQIKILLREIIRED